MITKLIVHCTATSNGRPTTIEEIDSWHKQKGWRKIGYHYVIYTDGTIEKGREEDEQGAHCKGHNKNSLGIALVGTDSFSLKQLTNLFILLSELKKTYKQATIHGHNEFSNKTCPGFNIKKLLLQQ